jgi:murein tripeptide amidase MpaA
VLLSRTHPAESVGSFVMRGVLDFLTSDKNEAKLLRDKFVFKIVPMVNPDGVIIGNSRC